MFRLSSAAFAGALCLSVASGASAQTVGDTTIGGGVSVLGPLIEGTYTIEPNLRVRGLVIGGWDFDSSESDDNGNTFDLDIDPAAIGVLIDHYPNASGLRFSGGLLFDMSEITAIGRPSATETFEFNGERFDAGRIVVDAGLQSSIAPMVTAGYEYALDDHWTLSAELGALYVGGFSATAEADTAELQDAVDADEAFQDELATGQNVNILPYLSVTMSYRF